MMALWKFPSNRAFVNEINVSHPLGVSPAVILLSFLVTQLSQWPPSRMLLNLWK